MSQLTECYDKVFKELISEEFVAELVKPPNLKSMSVLVEVQEILLLYLG